MSPSYMILTMVSSQFMLSLNIDDIYSYISPQTERNKSKMTRTTNTSSVCFY
jgi:hypothetical protein